jgi:TolB protein
MRRIVTILAAALLIGAAAVPVPLGGIPLAMVLVTTSSGSGSAAAASRSSLKGTIAFLSGSQVPNGIYLMRPDGSGLRRLENNQEKGAMPAWSPDGKRIAFADRRGGEHLAIYVVNADGSGLQQVTHPMSTDDESPSWSPDGRRIVFEVNLKGELGISVVNFDGSGRRRLTAHGQSPAWSPTGRRIAFVRQYGHGKCGVGFDQIWLANADGRGLRVLTHNCVDHDDPDWSPKGQWLVFSGSRTPGGDNSRDQLWLVNAHGTGLRRITRGRFDHLWPTWSPDGRRIAFSRTPNLLADNEPFNIYVIDTNGSGLRRLTRTGDEVDPDWSRR